jgi:type II secretory pathway pseudopilin PulG
MAVKKTVRLPASSLIETVLAMVLIGVVFSITTMIIVNVSRAGFTNEKMEAFAIAGELAQSTIKDQQFFDETITIGNYEAVRSVEDYDHTPNLKLLKIQVYRQDEKLLATRRQLVRIVENE